MYPPPQHTHLLLTSTASSHHQEILPLTPNSSSTPSRSHPPHCNHLPLLAHIPRIPKSAPNNLAKHRFKCTVGGGGFLECDGGGREFVGWGFLQVKESWPFWGRVLGGFCNLGVVKPKQASQPTYS